ncbi:hypothetical protein EV421DRAFT_1496578 [Armillaria borealis]|uniref:Uncharacterized protein n=1 Tax=Armillaria borealis TaxID=47425 RepID=A0AA39MGF3_9AGAR|nr:hypothetical protein EV421DRAFT_1496578 [Armillaria borealis]
MDCLGDRFAVVKVSFLSSLRFSLADSCATDFRPFAVIRRLPLYQVHLRAVPSEGIRFWRETTYRRPASMGGELGQCLNCLGSRLALLRNPGPSFDFPSTRPPPSHCDLRRNQVLRRHGVSWQFRRATEDEGLRMTGEDDDPPITPNPRIEACPRSVFNARPPRIIPSFRDSRPAVGSVICGVHGNARALLSRPDKESTSGRLCSPPSNPSRLIK